MKLGGTQGTAAAAATRRYISYWALSQINTQEIHLCVHKLLSTSCNRRERERWRKTAESTEEWINEDGVLRRRQRNWKWSERQRERDEEEWWRIPNEEDQRTADERRGGPSVRWNTLNIIKYKVSRVLAHPVHSTEFVALLKLKLMLKLKLG